MCATTKAARRRVGAERRGGFSERACLRAQHSVLHNSTHTIFLLHQMNQFLQNFIQHPEGAERERERKKNILHHFHCCHPLHHVITSPAPLPPDTPYLPLMLKFFPSIRCLTEGCLANAGRTDSKSASKPARTHKANINRGPYAKAAMNHSLEPSDSGNPLV